jgi:sterol desaturase/sphingolipid hydroxylase (fatty acid hydroxylase superfamily)
MGNRSDRLIRKFFDYSGAPILAVGVIALFILESRFELRKRKGNKLKRIQTNSVVAATASVALRLVLIPTLVRVALLMQKKNLGILRMMKLPPLFSAITGLLILDYGNYKWHKSNHETPWLWRLHKVHHADLDLDVSTALRFHFAEVIVSAFYRGVWVALGGISPQVVLLYEFLFEASNNFQHSNLKLPEKIDRLMANFIVTPRMHGIHHSIVKEETDSNYSIVLTVWDRLHRTLKLNTPQSQIDIGLPDVRQHLNAKELLIMPFLR